VIEPELGFDPVIVGFQFALYFVWLMFVSWMISRMIRDGIPPVRAGLCVVTGVIITWIPALARHIFDLNLAGLASFGWGDLIVQLGAPLAVFLCGWWWFHRQRVEDRDIAEIFE
jgi:hypothetical protein